MCLWLLPLVCVCLCIACWLTLFEFSLLCRLVSHVWLLLVVCRVGFVVAYFSCLVWVFLIVICFGLAGCGCWLICCISVVGLVN